VCGAGALVGKAKMVKFDLERRVLIIDDEMRGETKLGNVRALIFE